MFRKIFRKLKKKLLVQLQASVEVINKRQKISDKKIDESIALSHLMSLQPEAFVPLTSFSIFPTVVNRILNDVIINNRKNIIEFGAGASTIFLALLIKRNQLPIKFTSIESNKDWINSIKNILKINGCEEIVTFKYSPITPVKDSIAYSHDSFWYDIESIADLKSFNQKYDLVIVDGPQGDLCKNSRYPAIPFLLENLSERYSIFLDDFNRLDEQETSREWEAILSISPIYFSNSVVLTKGSEFSSRSFYDAIQ